MGALLGVVFVESRTGSQSLRDKAVDLSVGRSLLDNIQVYDLVLETATTNSCEKAENILRNYAWAQLKVAWDISKAYPGELDGNLNPVLLDVYPRLKRRLDFQKATRGRSPLYLQEMTNFMTEAEGLQSK